MMLITSIFVSSKISGLQFQNKDIQIKQTIILLLALTLKRFQAHENLVHPAAEIASLAVFMVCYARNSAYVMIRGFLLSNL